MSESALHFEYEPTPLEQLEQLIPFECRPDRGYLAQAMQTFTSLKEILKKDSFLISRLLKERKDKPNTLRFIIDPETNLVLSIDQGAVVVMIPALGCSIRAFNEISRSIAPGDYGIVESDNSWILPAIEHAEAHQRWSYTPGEIAPEEYLAAALTTFDNEPLKTRFRLSRE